LLENFIHERYANQFIEPPCDTRLNLT